jgi:hypothetical protein
MNLVRMPVAGHPPHTTNRSPLHHHLHHARCLRKIIFCDPQVAPFFDTRRVAKPRADHVQRELALEFRFAY